MWYNANGGVELVPTEGLGESEASPMSMKDVRRAAYLAKFHRPSPPRKGRMANHGGIFAAHKMNHGPSRHVPHFQTRAKESGYDHDEQAALMSEYADGMGLGDLGKPGPNATLAAQTRWANQQAIKLANQAKAQARKDDRVAAKAAVVDARAEAQRKAPINKEIDGIVSLQNSISAKGKTGQWPDVENLFASYVECLKYQRDIEPNGSLAKCANFKGTITPKLIQDVRNWLNGKTATGIKDDVKVPATDASGNPTSDDGSLFTDSGDVLIDDGSGSSTATTGIVGAIKNLRKAGKAERARIGQETLNTIRQMVADGKLSRADAQREIQELKKANAISGQLYKNEMERLKREDKLAKLRAKTDPTVDLTVPGTANPAIDPSTGLPWAVANPAINPATGLPWSYNPNQTPVDPNTGLPYGYGPQAQPYYDPNAGNPYYQSQGNAMPYNPGVPLQQPSNPFIDDADMYGGGGGSSSGGDWTSAGGAPARTDKESPLDAADGAPPAEDSGDGIPVDDNDGPGMF